MAPCGAGPGRGETLPDSDSAAPQLSWASASHRGPRLPLAVMGVSGGAPWLLRVAGGFGARGRRGLAPACLAPLLEPPALQLLDLDVLDDKQHAQMKNLFSFCPSDVPSPAAVKLYSQRSHNCICLP